MVDEHAVGYAKLALDFVEADAGVLVDVPLDQLAAWVLKGGVLLDAAEEGKEREPGPEAGEVGGAGEAEKR